MIFNKNGCEVNDETEKVIATAKKIGDLYYLDHLEEKNEHEHEHIAHVSTQIMQINSRYNPNNYILSAEFSK